jgi:hypothetical protein
VIVAIRVFFCLFFFQRAKRSANHAIIIDFCRESSPSVFFFASHLLQLRFAPSQEEASPADSIHA